MLEACLLDVTNFHSLVFDLVLPRRPTRSTVSFGYEDAEGSRDDGVFSALYIGTIPGNRLS
jgi:hypothetical protein